MQVRDGSLQLQVELSRTSAGFYRKLRATSEEASCHRPTHIADSVERCRPPTLRSAHAARTRAARFFAAPRAASTFRPSPEPSFFDSLRVCTGIHVWRAALRGARRASCSCHRDASSYLQLAFDGGYTAYRECRCGLTAGREEHRYHVRYAENTCEAQGWYWWGINYSPTTPTAGGLP